MTYKPFKRKLCFGFKDGHVTAFRCLHDRAVWLRDNLWNPSARYASKREAKEFAIVDLETGERYFRDNDGDLIAG